MLKFYSFSTDSCKGESGLCHSMHDMRLTQGMLSPLLTSNNPETAARLLTGDCTAACAKTAAGFPGTIHSNKCFPRAGTFFPLHEAIQHLAALSLGGIERLRTVCHMKGRGRVVGVNTSDNPVP